MKAAAVSLCVSAPTTTPIGGAAACRRAAVFTASPVRKPRPDDRVDVEAHQRLSGVDPAARLQRGAVRARHALESLKKAQPRAHGALGVVLVHRGHAEDPDDGVADELLHDAAMGLDDAAGAGCVVPAAGGRRPRGRRARSVAVKPTRSQNSVVTTLRSSEAARGARSEVAHCGQKAKSSEAS